MTLVIHAAGKSSPRRIEPTSSVSAMTDVHADSAVNGAMVDVHLERQHGDGSTWLVINNGSAFTDDGYGLALHSPHALHSLISALMGLTESPIGRELLASIRPKADDTNGPPASAS